jgi:hypothetical protein
VRFRTDNERAAVQTSFGLGDESQGMPDVLCRFDWSTGRDRQWMALRPARGKKETTPSNAGKPDYEREHSMLYTIAVILLVLWLLGLVTSYTMGGFIHILLVFAVVMVLVNLITGRRAL